MQKLNLIEAHRDKDVKYFTRASEALYGSIDPVYFERTKDILAKK